MELSFSCRSIESSRREYESVKQGKKLRRKGYACTAIATTFSSPAQWARIGFMGIEAGFDSRLSGSNTRQKTSREANSMQPAGCHIDTLGVLVPIVK